MLPVLCVAAFATLGGAVHYPHGPNRCTRVCLEVVSLWAQRISDVNSVSAVWSTLCYASPCRSMQPWCHCKCCLPCGSKAANGVLLRDGAVEMTFHGANDTDASRMLVTDPCWISVNLTCIAPMWVSKKGRGLSPMGGLRAKWDSSTRR